MQSTDELRNYLTANTQSDGSVTYTGGPLDAERNTAGVYGVRGPTGPTGAAGSTGESGTKAPTAQSTTSGIGFASDSQSHSTTNVQVTGVDEADTVKTDGKYIYTLNVNYTTEPFKHYPNRQS